MIDAFGGSEEFYNRYYINSVCPLDFVSLNINGKAQSNGRVSALMRSLDASNWFDNATLKVVDVVDQNGVLVSKFNMQVKEQRRKSGSGGVKSIR